MARAIGTADGAAHRRGTLAGRTASWCAVVATLAFAVGAWQVGIWANHWYIAERVYYPTVDEAAKEGPYWDIARLLYSGNQAMLTGLVCLAVAGLAAALAVLARRRAR
ncbi:hypothetical protein [Isoptericola sp. NPDC058082]|uniref:hypothetical protein n=1 Tax=Isoptericola sp. NPDC058082 TaxID=3346331 RepID=UPI0036EFF5FC